MKNFRLLFTLVLAIVISNVNAQEQFGKTLNLGIGFGGYNYGRSTPSLNLNYEFDVARNFTLAPFIGFSSYRTDYWWPGNKNYPARFYTYHETVIPIGIKGTYYFDQLLNLNNKWDVYAAASLGFAIVNSTYEGDYNGDRTYYGNTNYFSATSPLYFGIHIGGEYHFNNKLGLYLDLSNVVSTIGLAIHVGNTPAK